jgi:DNA-binding NarL/FixJ family response regulator
LVRVRLSVPSPALRAGLKAILAEDPEIAVLEGAEDETDPAGALRAADVVVLASAPSDWDSGKITTTLEQSAVLIVQDEAVDMRQLMRTLRPWGILPLDASADELCAAIHALAAGLIVGTGALFSLGGETRHVQGPLTDREVQILGLLSRGLANKQIALELGISEHTVKFHVSSIYGKLNASNRTQAVREGLQNGWIVL